MKYHKQLDDKTWVSFDDGEDVEWGDFFDGLKFMVLYIALPMILICGILCLIFPELRH
jgi:hypothetical protein